MKSMLNAWKGKVEIDNIVYDNIQDAQNVIQSFSDDIHIKLLSANKNTNTTKSNGLQTDSDVEYEITVKTYMTQKATPEFDFMAKFNNDNPMPMRIMQGTIEKETKGMVYMKLHGLAKPTITCYCCGKELTNPVSRHYGIGPICLGKLGIVRDIDDVENIREELVNITWEGWVIRSSILKKEIVEKRKEV